MAHTVELDEHVVHDDGGGDVRRLKAHGVDEELLLHGQQGVVEEAGLRVDVVEGRGEGADEVAGCCAEGGGEEAAARGAVGLLGEAVV